MVTVGATRFKAKCLELMDRVAERRETYVITKHGKPVAKLVPADPPKTRSVFGCMADQTVFVGDVEKPLYADEDWKEFEDRRAEQTRAWEREWRRYGTISGKKSVGLHPRRSSNASRRKRSRSKTSRGTGR